MIILRVKTSSVKEHQASQQVYSKCFSLNLEIWHISHENEIAISYKWKEPWFREKQRLKLKFRRKRKHKFVKPQEKSIKINNK